MDRHGDMQSTKAPVGSHVTQWLFAASIEYETDISSAVEAAATRESPPETAKAVMSSATKRYASDRLIPRLSF